MDKSREQQQGARSSESAEPPRHSVEQARGYSAEADNIVGDVIKDGH